VSPKIEWEFCCWPQSGLRRKFWKFPGQMYLMMPGKGTGSSCFLEQRYEVGCNRASFLKSWTISRTRRLKAKLRRGGKTFSLNRRKVSFEAGSTSPDREENLLGHAGDLTDETPEGELRRSGKEFSLNRRKVFMGAGSTFPWTEGRKISLDRRGIGGR
jgi:hypothetical protein